ncbi:DUF3307 domain-containing protein [Salibacterium salarium]|uniref:DUF3307 domain-containing protein n=1 Tax=Salibacterium salarium TaxID=284579 RepID=A0A428MSX8_9BACI|nr:DUF3307 domain-containing protein [Salibacterium salarium]RSL29235.1 DUF3307 domain-containing protein [Salibacterium salarium]
MTFLTLIFAHLLADYPLQGEFLATMKGKNIVLLFSHAGIWTGCIAVAGHLLGLDITVLDVGILFAVHAIADYLKAAGLLWYRKMDALKGGLISDQLIHAAQISLLLAMNGGI